MTGISRSDVCMIHDAAAVTGHCDGPLRLAALCRRLRPDVMLMPTTARTRSRVNLCVGWLALSQIHPSLALDRRRHIRRHGKKGVLDYGQGCVI
jgi:hypothetical protein